MVKFYIVHAPTNSTYHSLMGLQPIDRTEFDSVSEAAAVKQQLLNEHPNMSAANLHIAVV